MNLHEKFFFSVTYAKERRKSSQSKPQRAAFIFGIFNNQGLRTYSSLYYTLFLDID